MSNKFRLAALAGASALFLSLLTGCSSSNEQAQAVTELTVYSGRSEELIAPFFAQWESESGIKLNVRYGDSAELAAQILEEGSNSPADLFLAQDAGSLGAVAEAGLFTELSADVASAIPAKFVAANRNWVGVTGRARVFAYSPEQLKVLPKSVADLTNSDYKNQLGIAPTNASFQAFLTALINAKGKDFAKSWLQGLQANGVKIYPKNSAIVEAIDRGEISIGLVNHYYVWEVSEALGRDVKAKIEFFMASSKKYAAAQDLINFLTSAAVQQKFVTNTHEYSLIEGALAPTDMPGLDQIGAPTVDLNSLKDIKATQDLLIEVGLL